MLVSGLISAIAIVGAVAVCARSHSQGVRQWVLLLASCLIYITWVRWYALVLLASIAVNYALGEWVRRKPRAGVLAISIGVNLALLGVFKYAPEVVRQHPVPGFDAVGRILLPLGLSFWTFQAISYLFDLYREEELDPSFVEFSLYMSFFPVVISGPICRMPDMLPQFRAHVRTTSMAMATGSRRIATGILMMQMAKLLGQGILSGDGINSGFDRVQQWSSTDAWFLAIGFGLQLFFDFAGYSHIAIGLAAVLGFTVPENFTRPFASSSPSVFWTRWHMSLSFWIRDYVFLPLVLLRREMWWRSLSLVIAMSIFGVWHKATLLFLLWGAYHGVLLVVHRAVQAAERRWNWTFSSGSGELLSWVATMLFIDLGWIFFRANSARQARDMICAAFSLSTLGVHYLSGSLYGMVFALALGYAVALWVADRLRDSCAQPIAAQGLLVRNRWVWISPLYILMLLAMWLMTHASGTNAAQLMYRNF